MCLRAALLSEQFCRFANGGAKLSIKSYFMRSSFLSQCIQQQSSVRQNYFHSDKLPSAACWSREEKRGNCEANLL